VVNNPFAICSVRFNWELDISPVPHRAAALHIILQLLAVYG
jgi:hypothetical protein